VETLDLAGGILGADAAPQPPFVFQQEERGGTTPKILVQDNSRRVWSVKWGDEVNAEVFASRLLWATGYMVEPSYFVRTGKIDSVGALTRASTRIDRNNGNAFYNARFELRPIDVFPAPESWSWNDNPFVGTRELTGLRIMNMLLSNWDAKDARNRTTNMGILRVEREDSPEERQYLINDWGAAMGRWGGMATREKWSCRDFTSQTKGFVKGVENKLVRFSFGGVHAGELAKDIRVEDVAWLMQYLGRVTDTQLRDALTASGAAPGDVDCFAAALRDRIEQLRRAADSAAVSRR
jgi:hypothetical protein